MLIFLTLCALLQTPQGAPVAPFQPYNATCVDLTLSVREQSTDVGQAGLQTRTRYDIVKSCVVTIFACVWTAIHPNLNGPRDSVWTRFKRSVTRTIYAVLAPELMFWWAAQQYAAARYIRDTYNKRLPPLEGPTTSVRETIKGWFRPLPKATTRRGNGHLERWTITHGFFLQMGGFMLYENEYPKAVLTLDSMLNLIAQGFIDRPTVTQRELEDRSKGDTISKGLVILQTTWFAFHCFARLAQPLPLSELEVLTLAFTFVNVGTYAAWWNKPQNVDTAVFVPLQTLQARPNPFVAFPNPERHIDFSEENSINTSAYLNRDELYVTSPPPHSSQSVLRGIPRYTPLSETHSEPANMSWLQSSLQQDRQQHSFMSFLLVWAPFRIAFLAFRPLEKIGMAPDVEGHRVPMFHWSATPNGLFVAQLATVIGTMFGAIHLIAWNSLFDSFQEQIVWGSSTAILAAFPSVFLMNELFSQNREVSRVCLRGYYATNPLFFVLVVLYPFARAAVIVISLKTIITPAQNVLLDVSWTSYIPHF